MSGALTVLGGCGGMARALVPEAAQAGYEVHVIDLPQSIGAHPPGGLAMATSATLEAELERAAVALPSDLEGFVILSGLMADNPAVAEANPDTGNKVLTGNLNASYNAARIFHPMLAKYAPMVMTGRWCESCTHSSADTRTREWAAKAAGPAKHSIPRKKPSPRPSSPPPLRRLGDTGG